MEIEELINKKRNYEKIKENNLKEQPVQGDNKRKRGPKSGFIYNKINNEFKRILEESDIPCEIENGEVVIKANSKSKFMKDKKDLLKKTKKSKVKSINNVNETNVTSNSYDEIIKQVTDTYQKCIEQPEIKNKNLLDNCDFFSMDDFKFSSDPIYYKNFYPEQLENNEDVLIEFKNDYINEIVSVDFNLISDFFKYNFDMSLVINPGILIMKIKQKIIEPFLLFAIYAGAYLFRPDNDINKFYYYYDKAYYCILNTIRMESIQNIQAAFILANLVPGTSKSYILSGFTVRRLKLFDLYRNSNDMNDIYVKEYLATYYTFINTDLLLNITCNCIPDILSWFNQAIPKNLIERFFLFEKHPFENLSIKYFVVTNFLVKVVKYKRNCRNGIFSKKIFKRLFKESDNITETLKKDFMFIQNSEFKSQLQSQYYLYLLFYMAKLFLFNMELSPYIYDGKLIPLKKYVKIKAESTNINSPLQNIQNHSSNKDSYVEEEDSSDCNSKFSTDYFDENFQKRYQEYSILENIKYPGFIYKVYDESEKSRNDDKGENEADEEDERFLDIPSPISSIDYKNCYRICYETAEKATLFLKEINEELKPFEAYPYYLCTVFYHIGLFYMIAYTNFKEEKDKENIEYYQEQIKAMGKYFPFISYYYLKTYKKAKKEAYIAFQDDSILFCPRGLI